MNSLKLSLIPDTQKPKGIICRYYAWTMKGISMRTEEVNKEHIEGVRHKIVWVKQSSADMIWKEEEVDGSRRSTTAR